MAQPISKSPLTPLQKVLLARLRGDTVPTVGLVALLGSASRVVDQPPEGEAKPYVRIGEHLSTDDNTLTSFGREITETFHIWTKARSNGPGQDISARIVELLDHQTAALSALLVPAGHRVVRINAEFDQALTDPDPEIRHHVLRFRVVTAQLT